jgi:hypothetical protein
VPDVPDVMSPDGLLSEARTATGLDDFGSDDFREGLAVYCESVASEAKLNDVGAVAVRANVVANLANRLRVVDWAARHPDVAGQRIDAPLVVIGMFRAGTTFLSNLLDQDQGNRSLLRWEAGDSVPPPTPAPSGQVPGSTPYGRAPRCSSRSTPRWPPSTTRRPTAPPSASPS